MPWNSRFFQRDLLAFNTFHAELLQWAQAVRCGCSNTPTTPNNTACAVCGGIGYFYPSPLAYTRAVLTSVTQTEDLLALGLAQMGDLVCDQPPGATSLSPWDLILTTWTSGVPFQGEVVVRGSGTADSLTFRANTVYAVIQSDPVTGTVTTYSASDYSVSGKTVTWLANAPAAGMAYTIRYNATYEWVVFAPGLVRMERGTNLGPRTILRKREIALPNAPGDLLPG